MTTVRTAIYTGQADIETIRRFLPSNYKAAEAAGVIVIQGEDKLGWTLDEYVIPRLGSGMFFVHEAKFPEEES